MKGDNSKGKSVKSIKDFFQENSIPIIFSVIVLIGVFLIKQSPQLIMNELIQGFIGNAILVIALLIPVMAGMGFNFGIGIGAIAGQIGIIMAVSWKLSGFVGLLTAVAIATPVAIIFGILAGMVLNKARGYETIASLFVGYVGNAIYQFVFLYFAGTVIPITAGLLLTKGTGLINSIDLKYYKLYHSIDGLLQVPFFFLLFATGLILLTLSIYRLKKDTVASNKKRVHASIILSIAVIICSAMIMYMDVLPKEISTLKDVKFPLITGMFIGLIIVFNLLITRTKMGKAFLKAGLNQINSNDPDHHVSIVRITAIVISTVVAAWGQIIFLQSTGYLSTWGSHLSVGIPTVLALIVGGASISKATVKHALLGIVLVQSFLIITPLWVEQVTPISFSVFQVIIFNSVLLYAFAMSRSKKYISAGL